MSFKKTNFCFSDSIYYLYIFSSLFILMYTNYPLALSFFEYSLLIFSISLKVDFLRHQYSAIFPFYCMQFRLYISLYGPLSQHLRGFDSQHSHCCLDLNIFMFLINLFIKFPNVLGYFVYISGFDL